ncbi:MULTISPECIES: nuclease-related domain-containing protein [unclassified Streptomyces]|uniref:NERD domain-containing protein n=1 Tax=Streptomyces sp. NBC_00119 TaxID=2975659 RepID=A0AAU1U8P5_9ACTN|nr:MULTISPECIES: nuclease-related domain-containing protein [unclassified Streptomyces]MCX4643211.1 NERD domain-containing protein [Streptomyces sp. NBC_01446]MCX5324333.1 NERD domain-containing protein [Streptomyces sp. NBC_00120]
MSGLRVIPTWRHGRERLYVCGDDGRNVAWYDREAGRVNLISEARRDAVLDVLGPFLTGQVTVGPPPVPTPAELGRLALHPDDDLAPNRPGEALQIAVDRDPGPPRRLRGDPRRRALEAEQSVGGALDAFERAGWRVLHSVPLPGGARIHHLLIGPGGLYALHTLPARKQRVRVADPMVMTGRSEPHPLLSRVRADAARASFALTAEVRPVLAVAGATTVEVAAPPRDVRIVVDTELQSLARTGGVLKPADVEALHAMARDRHTWLRV